MATRKRAIASGHWPTRLALAAVFVATGDMVRASADRTRYGATLRIEQIEQAIERGIAVIYDTPPPTTFEPAWKYKNPHDHMLHHPTGNHALANWALLACGQSYQNVHLLRRINIVLASDTPYVFDRGMRAQMLAELPRQRWRPWVHRDGVFLAQALTDAGNFTRAYNGTETASPGDNAHGQYGVLGLAGLRRAGWNKLKNQTWTKIDAYWRAAQQSTANDEPAGWAVYSLADEHSLADGAITYYTRIRGPMTAGAVAVLANSERQLYGPKMDMDKQTVSSHLRKGLLWLDQNFTLSDPAESLDRYFYFFTIQSVGRYTGYRTFNGIDWFREVTAKMLAEQQSDGSWSGPKGRLLSTSFALLYLARANDPLAISKVRWSRRKDEDRGESRQANWNNRPHDLWNFVDHVSDIYEASTTWQIAELNQPVYELIESPILYLATDASFSLTESEIQRLRDYISAGGLLVTNPDANSASARTSMVQLADRLFAEQGFALKQMDMDHLCRHIHAKDIKIPIQLVENGIRPLMIHFPRDIGGDLQSNETKSPSFQALSNIYLYVTGLKPHRARLANTHVVLDAKPRRKLEAARIKYAPIHEPEPAALAQLKAILANDHQLNLKLSTVTPKELSGQKIAFLTAVDDAKLSDKQATAILNWIEAGGTLWVDAAGGGQAASKAVRQIIDHIAGDLPRRTLGRNDPIVSGRGLSGGYDCTRVNYRFFALRGTGRLVKPQLEAVELNGRPVIVYSTMDLSCGMAGLNHWGIFGYATQWARKLVVNGCLEVRGQRK